MVELRAVIEINYWDDEVIPPKAPYWELTQEWDDYRIAILLKKGYELPITLYSPVFPFIAIELLNEENLTKMLLEHTNDLRAGVYDRFSASPFPGGFVLVVDGESKFFPQCCGDLSDIRYWEQLALGNESANYEGHPAPLVSIDNGKILLQFVDELEEFQPTPEEKSITISQKDLFDAVQKTKDNLRNFGAKLVELNQKLNLEIAGIDNLLIWGE
jgi:hypothetical protein